MAWGTQDSWNGIALNVLNTGRSRSAGADISKRKVPGGNVTVINNGGQKVRERQYDLYVPDEATLVALENACGATGTLTYWGGTAMLMLEFVDASEWWDGGQQKVRATFTVVS